MFPITVPKDESIGNMRSAYFRINQLSLGLIWQAQGLYAWINLELGETYPCAFGFLGGNSSGRDVA